MTRQQLLEAIQAKRSTAVWALHALRQMEQPTTFSGENPRDELVAFLEAARGIFLTIQTFATPLLPNRGFMAWAETWENNLETIDRALWDLITDQRDAQTHGPGPDLIGIDIPLNTPAIQEFSNIALLGIPPEDRPRSSKSGIRFAAHPTRLASDVCEGYLKLTERFEADFRQAHAAIL